MFFGLEVKSSLAQAKPISLTSTLKLTQAVLEPVKNGKKEPVSLVVEYEKKQSILCVLDPSLAWQTPLDLLFESGSQVKFSVRGTGTVHLTGYEIHDDLDDMSLSMSSDEEVEVEESDDGIKETVKNKMVKNLASKGKTNGVKGPTKKKDDVKVEDDDDDESSDDEDYSVENLEADDDDDDDDDEDEEMSDENLESAESDDE